MVREQWQSRLGFVLATVGSALGVGNIWRFPHLVGQNGGGAFLVAYLVVVMAAAVPLLILELAVGRRYATNVFGAFTSIGRRYRWAGLAVLLLVGGILSYYLVIVAWGLGFFARSLVGRPLDFALFAAGWEVVLFFTVALLVVMVIVAQGVKRGIETGNLWLMPLLFLLIAVLAVYGLTLDGRAAGLTFYLRPEPAALTSTATWSAALGQAFFSVGVGMGVMVTYGSYVSRSTDLHTSALWVVFADTAAAVLVGLMIFPMVFTFGLQPAAGPTLAFQTLPAAFELLPLARLWAALFFLLFAIAGISSAISMLETAAAPLIDGRHWRRWHAVAIVGLLVFLAGLPSALSYSQLDLRLAGAKFLDVMDTAFGSLGVPLGALIGSLIMAWAMRRKDIVAEVNQGAGRFRVGVLVVFLTRYVVPMALLVVLVITVLGKVR